MANSYVGLPPDSSGKKLDAESLTVAGIPVIRERDQIAGKGSDEIAEVKASDPSGTDHGLVTRSIEFINPLSENLFSADLAAGSSVDLDSIIIPNGSVAKLVAVSLSSSVPCKWVIKKVVDNVETTFDTVITTVFQLYFLWRPPSKEFCKLTGNGSTTIFRVTPLNLDKLNSANVYSTLYFDEA